MPKSEPFPPKLPQETPRHQLAGPDCRHWEVLARVGLPSFYTILMHSQLRWAVPVARMSDQRLPKRLFYGELQRERRSYEDQKKRFEDTLKNIPKAFGINRDTWEETAEDRVKWTFTILKRLHDVRGQQDSRNGAMETGKESQRQRSSTRRSRHPLPMLPENLPSTDWPCQPSAHPQTDPGPTTLG